MCKCGYETGHGNNCGCNRCSFKEPEMKVRTFRVNVIEEIESECGCAERPSCNDSSNNNSCGCHKRPNPCCCKERKEEKEPCCGCAKQEYEEYYQVKKVKKPVEKKEDRCGCCCR